MNTSNAAASVLSAVRTERAGTRQYIGRSSSGTGVRIGMDSDEFSSDELMRVTLTTYNILSADCHPAKALSEDFEATTGYSTVKNDAEERYGSFQVEIIIDLSSLDAEQRKLLSQRVVGAVDRHYTVGRTIERGASYTMTTVDLNEN